MRRESNHNDNIRDIRVMSRVSRVSRDVALPPEFGNLASFSRICRYSSSVHCGNEMSVSKLTISIFGTPMRTGLRYQPPCPKAHGYNPEGHYSSGSEKSAMADDWYVVPCSRDFNPSDRYYYLPSVSMVKSFGRLCNSLICVVFRSGATCGRKVAVRRKRRWGAPGSGINPYRLYQRTTRSLSGSTRTACAPMICER